MNKQYYVLHLLPSRPDFATSMTNDERTVMMQHIGYWTDLMNKGKALVFGPVMDPKGIYGLGIVAVDNEEELNTLIVNDPAAKINKYEYYSMRAITPGSK